MTTPVDDNLASNALLEKLTPQDRARLAPHLTAFDLAAGHVLHPAGEDVDETWFPCGGAMAAFCVSTNQGANQVEVAVVGREGAVGGIVSNGHLPAYATAEVRFAGRFLRIKTAALELAKLESLPLRHWFSRYSDCLLAQVFQTAACNATHTIAQRTAKWLLAAAARTNGNVFELTQDELAQMLGVGRTFVNGTLKALRDKQVIATRRGFIEIKDTAALRRMSCGCTVAIEEHFDIVLQGIYAS
ncbi:Crp/Fnr family transcriptional regulator [Phenylobacterium sp.]|uniref:Crp/Fnr family transcriptional regulator n=1 Tax=Phenylobacterium sp. TaxID=1871053 RepID=UPI0025FC249B|nr:Crp/Fnr family transcriptional regulator [Phenylobacterium sp.]